MTHRYLKQIADDDNNRYQSKSVAQERTIGPCLMVAGKGHAILIACPIFFSALKKTF